MSGWGVGTSGSACGIVKARMGSTGHHANILNPAHREIGIALDAKAPTGPPVPGATYTTVFGTGSSTSKSTSPAGTSPPDTPGTTAPETGQAPAANSGRSRPAVSRSPRGRFERRRRRLPPQRGSVPG